jgi:hypothetical protein
VAEDVLVEVDLQVRIADAAVGAVQPGLEVRDGAVRARQQLLAGLGQLAAAAVVVAELREAVVSRPAVGVDNRGLSDVLCEVGVTDAA